MDTLLQDVRYALRQMRRSPVLATAIVLTIGLGLGAATAIFTSSEAALVEPLPYAAPDRLVHLWELRAGTDERSPTSYPTLLDWRARTTSFVGLEGYDPSIPVVGTGDEARMLRGAEVTAGFFRLTDVRPGAGRTPRSPPRRAASGPHLLSPRRGCWDRSLRGRRSSWFAHASRGASDMMSGFVRQFLPVAPIGGRGGQAP